MTAGRKPDTPLKSDPVEGDLDRPRCHHYQFAHHALRSFAFENPLAFLMLLASPEAQEFLSTLMAYVLEECKKTKPQPDLPIEDVALHKGRVGGYPCVVVEMPRPKAITEAFFVAAVLLADLDNLPDNPKNVELRYFTLEKGATFGGGPPTVLCEWTSDHRHLNYGDGPAPRLEMFVQALEELISSGTDAGQAWGRMRVRLE